MTLLSGARNHRHTLIEPLFYKNVLCAFSTSHHINLLLSLFLFSPVASQSGDLLYFKAVSILILDVLNNLILIISIIYYYYLLLFVIIIIIIIAATLFEPIS